MLLCGRYSCCCRPVGPLVRWSVLHPCVVACCYQLPITTKCAVQLVAVHFSCAPLRRGGARCAKKKARICCDGVVEGVILVVICRHTTLHNRPCLVFWWSIGVRWGDLLDINWSVNGLHSIYFHSRAPNNADFQH